MNQELIDYIKKAKEKGVNDDYLIQHLIKYGYTREVAENAILEYKKLYPESKNKEVLKSKEILNNKKKSKLFLFIIAFILIVSAFILVTIVFFNAVIKNISGSFSDPCPDVNIEIMKKDNEPMVCLVPSVKTLFILENKGVKVNGFEIYLIGNKGNQFFSINDSLESTESMPIYLDYDIFNNGNLTKLKITPIKDKKCKELVVEVKNFGVC